MTGPLDPWAAMKAIEATERARRDASPAGPAPHASPATTPPMAPPAPTVQAAQRPPEPAYRPSAGPIPAPGDVVCWLHHAAGKDQRQTGYVTGRKNADELYVHPFGMRGRHGLAVIVRPARLLTVLISGEQLDQATCHAAVAGEPLRATLGGGTSPLGPPFRAGKEP